HTSTCYRACPRSYVFTAVRLRPTGYTLFPYTTLFRSISRAGEASAKRRQPAKCVRIERKSKARQYERGSDIRRKNQQKEFERRRSEEHTSELQSREKLVCRLLLEKKNPV